MKKTLIAMGLLFASAASADTLITYDDGSTYTVKPNEEVYVSSGRMYNAIGGYNAGYFKFNIQKPNAKRDYVQPEEPEGELCWAWGGIAPPPGYSTAACEEEVPSTCVPGGLTLGGAC
jgi:hypothetical protein